MDIRNILSWVKTLSPEQKDQFLAKYEAGTLSDVERKELIQHVLNAMKDVKEQVDEAKEILAALDRKSGSGK